MPSPFIAQRAAAVKLLVLDIDGVLTDGRVIYGDQDREIKVFDIKDGSGLTYLMRAGLKVCLISGRKSAVNRMRAKELGIEEIHEDAKVKLPILQEVMARSRLAPEQVAYMGDDLIDLPCMRAVGLALAPADAVREVKALAHWVSSKPGGRGAVRQACELILRSSGAWEEVIARYY